MPDAIRKCWALLPAGYRWGLFGLFLLMNLNALAQLAMVGSVLPFLQAVSDTGDANAGRAASAVRSLLPGVDESALLPVFAALVVAAVVAANAIGATYTILSARFGARLNAHLSTLLLRSYLHRPYPYYLTRNTSEFFRNIFSEVGLVTGGFLATATDALTRILTILGLGILLLAVSPWVALAAGLFFTASYTGIYFILRRRLARTAEKRSECDKLRFKAVSEAFGTLKELKVLRREDVFIRAFERPSRRYFHFQERSQLYASLPRHVVETVAFAGMIAVALYLLQRHGGVAGALPVLGLFAVAGYRLMPAIQGLYRCFSRLRYYTRSVHTVYRECAPLLRADGDGPRRPVEEAPAPEDTGRLPLRERIELRDVGFTYPNSERPALTGVNLTLPARSRIGLCGRSGSGKTTLADILLGLLRPGTGEMLVDGTPIDGARVAGWQRSCGYVPQQIYLIDDTIRRNIAYGIPPSAIHEESLRRAARLANLDSFVENELPDGYDTVVGERGIRLSGGQRQRVGIARALYHDPDLVVLDEATSSLDAETEKAIVEAVESLAGRKTVLMIAHRFSTIRRCDTIVFLDQGALAAVGGYEALRATDERFRRLAEL